jgi:hypothetical protein
MNVTLTASEIDELFIQRASTRGDGGYQSLLVSLQERVNKVSGAIVLTHDDLERIPRYAFDYGNGGWENRLSAIFGRVIGPKLGR